MEELMTGSAQLLVTVANLLTLGFVIYVFYLLLMLVRQFMRGGGLDLRGMLVLAFLLMVVPIFLRRYPAIVIQAGADGLANSRQPATQMQVQLVDWAMDSITPLAGMAPAVGTVAIQGATMRIVDNTPTPTVMLEPAVVTVVVTATPTPTLEQQIIVVTATPTAPPLGDGQNAIVATPTAEPTFDPAIWNAQTPPPTPAAGE